MPVFFQNPIPRQAIFAVMVCSLALTFSSCAKRTVLFQPAAVMEEVDAAQPVQPVEGEKERDTSGDVSATAPEPQKDRSRSGAPLTDFITANFVGSHHCARCHNILKDSAGKDVSISGHWRSTMMANAAKDPFWQAKVKSEIRRNPKLAGIIDKKCIACHMPMAHTQAVSKQKELKAPEDALLLDELLNPSSSLHEAAMDGVSCSLCHQIRDIKIGRPESFSGEYSVDSAAVSPERPIYGPFHETYPDTMINTVGFTPTHGPHLNDSGFCATCHTLYTPYVDATGEIQGEFPEQTVYLEWLHSDYGRPAGERQDIGVTRGKTRLCQDCHMPRSESGGVIIANPAHKNVKRKDHFFRHHFAGGNVFMLNMLHDHIVPVKVSASTEELKDTGRRSLEMLQAKSGRLTIDDAGDFRNRLTIDIRVENIAGHKFPTGFPSRRAWIHLTVLDGNDEIVFESGKTLRDGGIAGDNSDENNGYEPHYDEITQDNQVQIYEAVMHNTRGETTYTLLRAAGYLKDNRLLPRGFDKGTAPADIKAYGLAGADENFTGGGDRITYKVNTGDHEGPYTVKAELLYTPVSHAFANDLRRDDFLPTVKRFRNYYDKADNTPVTISADQRMVK